MPTPVPSVPLYTNPPGPCAAPRSTINPHPSRKTPSGALSRRPQGMFFVRPFGPKLADCIGKRRNLVPLRLSCANV